MSQNTAKPLTVSFLNRVQYLPVFLYSPENLLISNFIKPALSLPFFSISTFQRLLIFFCLSINVHVFPVFWSKVITDREEKRTESVQKILQCIRIFSFNNEVCFYYIEGFVLTLIFRLKCSSIDDKISTDSRLLDIYVVLCFVILWGYFYLLVELFILKNTPGNKNEASQPTLLFDSSSESSV